MPTTVFILIALAFILGYDVNIPQVLRMILLVIDILTLLLSLGGIHGIAR